MNDELLLNAALWAEIFVLSVVILGHALVPKAPQLTLETLRAGIQAYAAADDSIVY